MLEWRDNYTARSEVTTDNVPQRRAEQIRTEQRESREEPSPSDCLTAKGARLSPPPEFKITESLQEWATKTYPSVDIKRSTDKFLRHEFSKPKSNWDAAWQTWIQREAEHQENNNGPFAKPSHVEQFLLLGQELGLERKPDESDAQYVERVELLNNWRIEGLG